MPMRARVLPKHTPSLHPGDYLPCVAASLPGRRAQPGLREVWRELLAERELLGMPSGRHALWHFLETVDLPRGSEVLVSAYNFYVVVRLIEQCGLRPVFVDTDPRTLCMDPADLRRKLTPSSALVLVTHMFGIPAAIEAIAEVCAHEGLLLFEDCAHAVGTTVGERHVGGFGDGALFSFGPFKSVTAFGGGMLALSPSLARRARREPRSGRSVAARARVPVNLLIAAGTTPALYAWTLRPLTRVATALAERGSPLLRDLAAPAKDNADYRFDPDAYPPFAASMPATLAPQLGRLHTAVARRRATIAHVSAAIGADPRARFLDGDAHGLANGSYFGMYVDDPEAFTASMIERGVEVNPHEFYDCSRLPQFAEFAAECPRAAYVSDHLVRLPSYASLDGESTARILDAAMSALERSAPVAPPPVAAQSRLAPVPPPSAAARSSAPLTTAS